MTSNLFSRWTGTNNATASIYETIRQHDEDSQNSDIEDQAASALDERNLRETFQDVNPDHFDQPTLSRISPHRHESRVGARVGPIRAEKRSNKPKWMQKGHKLLDVEEADDDVPASLLIEGNDVGLGPGSIALPPPPSLMRDRNVVRSPIVQSPRAQQARVSGQGYSEPARRLDEPPPRAKAFANLAAADPREKAMWRWTNVVNLDNFLSDVYDYYVKHGFWSILLTRCFGMMTSAFVVGFSLFLTQCVNYSLIQTSKSMDEVLVHRCVSKMGFGTNALLWLFTFGWICKAFQYTIDLQRLHHLHDFYLHLLNISEDEIQSISWQEIVSRLMALRDSNPTVASNTSAKSRRYATTQNKQRMDAHDIANRLMRKENYMIAMVNKEILDMTLPIPLLRNRQLFTRTLEWNLNWCIMDYFFNEKGQVRPLFLKDTHRKDLSEGLRRRFVFAATANLIIAPFLIVFFLFQNFFIYFNEYQKNPSQIGTRQYNALAEWKFREFNEVWHLFQRRINMSYPFATRYINQFPKDKTIQAARFISFVSGAIVSVLGLATILEQEKFLAFEITSGRTTIFYIGLFGGIWAVARGLLPDENMVYEPAYSMGEVIEFTHYEPAHWKNRLHTVEVKQEFEQLYQMKIVIFIEEVLSMVFTPFVLWFSLPKCSDRIIDFIREFTVHVDGIGYVCSFAEFKFRKPTEAVTTAVGAAERRISDGNQINVETLRDDYYASRDQKLEQSYWGFMNDYARNPKTDVRFPYSSFRRRINLPPPVPGLLSPVLPSGFDHQAGYATGRQQQNEGGSMFSPQRTTGITAGAPGFAAQNTGSPLQSILLDPHHQPSASGFGGSQAFRSRSVAAPSPPIARMKTKRRGNTVDPPERVLEQEDDLDDNRISIGTQLNTSDSMTQAKRNDNSATGDLGSWKYDDEKSDTSDEEDAQAIANDGVGVLGLIKQFRKTQSDTGRNIAEL